MAKWPREPGGTVLWRPASGRQPRAHLALAPQRGQALYDQQLQAQVEARQPGQCLVLDIETGDYEIDADDVAAIQRVQAKHPDEVLS